MSRKVIGSVMITLNQTAAITRHRRVRGREGDCDSKDRDVSMREWYDEIFVYVCVHEPGECVCVPWDE